MNQFNLPGCLFIEEGACERLNEILADCIPGIEKKRTVIATEESLLPVMGAYLDEMKRDLPKSELYLIEENRFEEAMELAKYICMKDVEVIIGVGGGKVLDAAHRGDRVDGFSYLLSDMAFSSLCYNEEKSLKSKEFIKILTQALVLGGLAMEIAGNSRPCSGAEHLFCHSLEENYREISISHGMAVALGSLVSCRLQGRDASRLETVMKAYHMDMDPMNWGITKEIFTDAWLRAADTRKDRYTVLNEVALTEELFSGIYDELRR